MGGGRGSEGGGGVGKGGVKGEVEYIEGGRFGVGVWGGVGRDLPTETGCAGRQRMSVHAVTTTV